MIKRIVLTFIILLVLTTAVTAQFDKEKEVLFKLFNTEENEVEILFDKSFLNQVSANQLIGILKQYHDQLGQLKKITGSSGDYTLIFVKGTAPAKIVLNNVGKITGLWFGNWILTEDDLAEVISEFKSITGAISVSVIKNNQDKILSYNSNRKMAVGSSFKLYVLKAVYDAVQNGKISWDSLVILNQDNKSLASGILQDWPKGTPLTIKTLSNLMISLSDNTATDLLINAVGRENIEKYVTEINIPFLKTIDLLRLKYAVDSVIQTEYIKAGIEKRRQILNNIKNLPVKTSVMSSSPRLITELEWFFSTQELCQLIYKLRDADEIRINPGLAVKKDWQLVGYKGGSEPGVLQYTHILQREAGGDIYTVSITVNNPKQELDTDKITELTRRLISLIKQGKI